MDFLMVIMASGIARGCVPTTTMATATESGQPKTQTMQTADCADRADRADCADWVLFSQHLTHFFRLYWQNSVQYVLMFVIYPKVAPTQHLTVDSRV